MPHTITGYFDTRRDAEMTVEHLVQDHDLDRNRVQVMAEGEENSAGTVVSGADAADAAAGEAPEGVRRGRIMVRAEVGGMGVDEDHVRLLARFEGADLAVEREHLRAFAGRHMQDLRRVQGGRVERLHFLQPRCRLDLFEQVERRR